MLVADHIVRTLADFGRSHPNVQALYVFGSRVQGDARPDSDLDVGLLWTQPQALEMTLRFEDDLEQAVGLKVNLIDAARASVFVALAIVQGERLFVRDPVEADQFELYVLRRAGDLLPFERARQAMLLTPSV